MLKCSGYRPGVVQRVGIALLFHGRGTRMGWVVSSTPRPYFTPGKDPVPILQEAGWASGPVWTGGKSRPHRIRSRTAQPVISHYTDWATRSTIVVRNVIKFHRQESNWHSKWTFFCNMCCGAHLKWYMIQIYRHAVWSKYKNGVLVRWIGEPRKAAPYLVFTNDFTSFEQKCYYAKNF